MTVFEAFLLIRSKYIVFEFEIVIERKIFVEESFHWERRFIIATLSSL